MYILAGLLATGFICNLMIQPVAKKYYMTRAQIAELDASTNASSIASAEAGVAVSTAVTPAALVVGAWLAVGIPIAWGVYVTFEKAVTIFAL